MLPGTGLLAFPATCTLGWIDREKPVSDHFDDLLPTLILAGKVLGAAPGFLPNR
jgi:hypothetical protein